MCDFLDDGLSEESFYHKLEQVYQNHNQVEFLIPIQELPNIDFFYQH